MPNYAKFLRCSGTVNADNGFLMEYEKAVLLTLQSEGVIDQFELEKSLKMLKLQEPLCGYALQKKGVS